MEMLILAVIAVAVFFWYKQKKKGDSSTQGQQGTSSAQGRQGTSSAQERKEREKQEKEQRINDFLASINLTEELDYIFNVLEKSGATAANFEKGVGHILSKVEVAIPKEEILSIFKKELFARAFSDTECTVAKCVATDYFVRDVVEDKLLLQYMSFAISREGKYPSAEMQEPFIKALYGVAGRAVNYLNNGLTEGDYRTITSVDYVSIIEDSDVLRSYTDGDPFAADTVRAKWAKDLCHSPLEIVKSSKLSSFLDKEEHIDALCCYAYAVFCGDKRPAEGIGVSDIATVYVDHLKAIYNRIKR